MISSSELEGRRAPEAVSDMARYRSRSDLDHDRQHERPAAKLLVDELGDVVVQVLLEQRDLPDLLFSRLIEGVLDDVLELISQAVRIFGERHTAEDHLGVRDLRAVVRGDRG